MNTSCDAQTLCFHHKSPRDIQESREWVVGQEEIDRKQQSDITNGAWIG